MAPPLSEAHTALEALCRELRVDIIEMVHAAGSGHPGGSLSAIDLVATLYERFLKHDPKRPGWADRDRFILSKGHAAPALYAVLAHRGYFDRSLLSTLRKLGSPLQGHPVVGTAPGVEACTGSLGQGLSIALGVAIAARLDEKDLRSYCMLGDGEIQEGQVWEAAMWAGDNGVDNLVAILDYNKAQLDGTLEQILPLEPVEPKWQAFGWSTRRIDGHDLGQILDAYEWAQARDGKPKLIVADTIKGKGVSFMEGAVGWHGAAPDDEQKTQAIAEIRGQS
ncbi:MAG: transketolase [Myxococcales bacterium]|jgi:transketolase